jgi:hypothetical protein
MTFNFVDKDWNHQCFPLTFFDTGATGTMADDHAAIVRAAVREKSRIGEDVTIFAGTSDTEAPVALGVAKFVGFESAVRCLCHTLALAVNAATQTSEVATCLLQRIADIATFLNERKEAVRQLASAQLRAGVSPDRIKRFHRADGTRWHIELHALLDWLDLKKYLADLLPEHLLIDDMFEAAIVDIVVVCTWKCVALHALSKPIVVSQARVQRVSCPTCSTRCGCSRWRQTLCRASAIRCWLVCRVSAWRAKRRSTKRRRRRAKSCS